MKYFRKVQFYYSSFSGKSERFEFSIYFIVDIFAEIAIYILNLNVNLDDKTIIYLFYIRLIQLLKFIPIQAAITRRLRFLNLNTALIFINYIPLVGIIFEILLIVLNKKTRNIETELLHAKKPN